MSDFRTVRGFEDVWRPPAGRSRTPTAVLSPGRASAGMDAKSRLGRIVARTPEVMVKVTGRTRDGGHLRAHLEYISRNGGLELQGRDGAIIAGLSPVRELAEDWTALAEIDTRRRANSPISLSVVLSMPKQTDPLAVRDAARAFAAEVFGDRFDYVFALHTDADHPHVHIAACSRGDRGERLNPKKADLEAWRQIFAQALRDRGVKAEATPRRARGVTRKAERTPIRKLRERNEAGLGAPAQVKRGALRDAAKAAFAGDTNRLPWETRMAERQAEVRGLYLAQAKFLRHSADPADRALGAKVEAFVRAMPQPDSQRLALARELRAVNNALGRDPSGRDKDRSR